MLPTSAKISREGDYGRNFHHVDDARQTQTRLNNTRRVDLIIAFDTTSSVAVEQKEKGTVTQWVPRRKQIEQSASPQSFGTEIRK